MSATDSENQKQTDRSCRSGAVPCSPCPFCGGKARMAAYPKREHDHMAFLAVECVCCGARGPVSAGVNTDKAWSKWNERNVPCSDGIMICINHHREETGELEERIKHMIGEFRKIAPVVRRLVRYADKAAMKFPKISGQNARVEGAAWLAKFDPENVD